jgi:uncharacterized membrane protein YbhN (UPF0104 family)
MSTPRKRILGLLIRIAVTTALLVWVVQRIDLDQFWQTVKQARWHYLLGVWFFTALFFGTQALAMQRVLRRQDCFVKLRVLLAASCVTALYSMILPGLLSTGVKWYILKRHTGRGTNVLSSMLYNQVMLAAVMFAMGLAAVAVTNPTAILFPEMEQQWVLPIVSGLLAAVVVLLPVLVLNRRTGKTVSQALTASLKPLPTRIREKGRTILAQLSLFQTAGLRFHLAVAGINLAGSLFVGVLIYRCAARAARVDVPLDVLIWLCATVFILGRLPISVANLGVREVTLVGLLTAYGVNEAAALLMSMILFTGLVFMAAIGGLIQVAWLARPDRQALPRESGT